MHHNGVVGVVQVPPDTRDQAHRHCLKSLRLETNPLSDWLRRGSRNIVPSSIVTFMERFANVMVRICESFRPDGSQTNGSKLRSTQQFSGWHSNMKLNGKARLRAKDSCFPSGGKSDMIPLTYCGWRWISARSCTAGWLKTSSWYAFSLICLYIAFFVSNFH